MNNLDNSELLSQTTDIVFPPFNMEIFYKFKVIDSNLLVPYELKDIVDKNKTTVPSHHNISNNHTWRKFEPKKTNWMSNKTTPLDKFSTNVKEILNKLSNDNFNILVKEIMNLNFASKEQLQELVDSIYSKAIIEQIFGPLYAKLCLELSPCCIENEGKKIYFRELLLNKCQVMFGIYTSKSEKEEISLNKMQVIGCIKFIGELYNIKLITDKIISFCIDSLIQKIPTHNAFITENICTLLTTIGKEYHVRDKITCDKYLNFIRNLIEQNNFVNKREKFMYMDLIDSFK